MIIPNLTMERIIKFRGKHISTGEWLFGSHYDDCGEEYILPNIVGSAIDYEDYQVDPNTVGQFTGVCDKDNAPIYEGDIVRNGEEGFYYVVEWWDDAAFRAKQIGSSSSIGLNCWRKYLKKCGNRYDNPELMEVKKPQPPKNGLLAGEFRIRALYENGCMSREGHIYVAQYVGKGHNKKIRVWDESSKLDEEYKRRYGTCCDMDLSILGDGRVEPIYEIVNENQE